MAPQVQVDPYATSRGFNQMVQLGQQRRDSEAAEQQRALDNQERNRLAQLQGEQFGLQKQRAGMEQQDSQMKTKEWLGTYAARAKASGNPQTARGIMREALQIAAPQRAAEFDALPDDQLVQQIEQLAAFAPATKQDAPSNVQEWEYYNRLPQDQKTAYLEMKRAQQTFLPTIAEVPTLVRPGVAGGPAQTQPLTNIPTVANNAAQVAGAEARAKGQAGAQVDAEAAATKNERIYNTFQTAMNDLDTALGGTMTGPMVGRSPAFTSAQQTANTSVSIAGNALKEIVRGAGEGTFTTGDQEFMMSMLSDRTTEPEARKANRAALDRFVRAKLGMKGDAPPGGGNGGAGQRLTPEQAAALPPGTKFVGMDGVTRTKK